MSKDVSVLNNGIVFNGKILSEGVIDISGKVEGIIVSVGLSVKKGGNINGDIFANEIIVAEGGIIQGNIIAEKIKILKGAKLEGNVKYNTLLIEDGVKMNGEFSYIDAKELNSLFDKEKNNIAKVKK